MIELFVQDSSDFADLLRRWDTAYQKEIDRDDMAEGDRLVRENNESSDEVVVSTIHAAKGREYEAVAIYDYAPKLTGMSRLELEEERRVLYVGATRAANTLLMTIDMSGGLHPYIKEMIKPGATGEKVAASRKSRELESLHKRLVIDHARHHQALDEIFSGAELERLKQRIVEIPGLIEKEHSNIGRLRSSLDSSALTRLWSTLTGSRRKLSATLAASIAAKSALDHEMTQLEDRVLLLENDPELAARDVRRASETASAEKLRNTQEMERLRWRIDELSLLGR